MLTLKLDISNVAFDNSFVIMILMCIMFLLKVLLTIITRQRTTVRNSGLALLNVFEYKLVQLHLACQTQDVTCLMRL